jgi:hypothetical protein
MRFLSLLLLVPFFTVAVAEAQTKRPKYKKIVVSDKFHAEGSCIGDFNKDGTPDIAVGHFWYEGPDFTKRHQFFDGPDAKDFDPKGYSNCFGMFTGDFNNDGWDDILVCPHPGTDGFWYENPKGASGMWKKHLVSKELGNESQDFANFFGSERGPKSLLFNRNGFLGFATPNFTNPYEPWDFVAVNDQPNGKFQRYTHGLGYGDITGNGKMDILEKDGWWENVSTITHEQTTTEQRVDIKWKWEFHPFSFADAAAHMFVFDVDGDGLNDVITATHCHNYGFAWYKQVRKDGAITFEKQVVIPRSDKLLEEKDWETLAEIQKPFWANVSQLHAFVAVDMNGDGIPDVVTGKRFWAHGPDGDTDPNGRAILMWWETQRTENGNAVLVPHVIDTDSGVGTQFAVGDLNKDGVPDIVIGNKKGAFVFLSVKE